MSRSQVSNGFYSGLIIGTLLGAFLFGMSLVGSGLWSTAYTTGRIQGWFECGSGDSK